MFSNHISKTIVLFAILATLISGCRRQPTTDGGEERPVLEPAPARVPFATAEPERFQARIVVASGEIRRQSRIARLGARRRFEFDADSPSSLVLIESEKRILLFPSGRKFAESETGTGFEDDELKGLLVTRWLNERSDATFEKLDSEAGTNRYRIRFGDEGTSEAIIAIDVATGLPIRQEFYSIADGVRRLTTTVEILDLKTEADGSLFAVPDGFQKISERELLRLARGST